jgi:hypothetical protein
MRRFVKPRAVEAYGVSRRMRSGRNQPLLLLARDGTGGLLRCVVKPRPRLAAPPSEYLFEWLGSALARRMGLTVPDPLAVTITSEFVSAVSKPFRTELDGSVGLMFGSRFVTMTDLKPRGHRLTASQGETAAQVLAFDVFIHNSDRRAENNNLFVDRNDIVLFDHELAFDFLLPIIGAADPVLDHCPSIVEQHVFFDSLRLGLPKPDRFRAALARLDDNFFAGLEGATPVEWTVDQAHGKLSRIVDVLRKRRDAVDDWLPKVFACLDR